MAQGFLKFATAALLLLAACQTDAPARPEGTSLGAAERADCGAQGGRVGRGGMLGSELCFMPTPDADKSCSTASDCSGMCLAETRTCSAETPRFGCFELLDDQGRKVGLCAD